MPKDASSNQVNQGSSSNSGGYAPPNFGPNPVPPNVVFRKKAPSEQPGPYSSAGQAPGNQAQPNNQPNQQQVQVLPVVVYQPTEPIQQPMAQRATANKKDGNKLLKVGIVVLVIAFLALVAVLLAMTFKPFGLFQDEVVEPPSQADVEGAFKMADIQEPNISSFMYVNSSNLDGPEIENVKVGEVVQGTEAGSQVYCISNAAATFENDSVSVTSPISIRMNYNKEGKDWTPEKVQYTSNDPTVTPQSGPDMEKIEANFQTILETYDTGIATLLQNAKLTVDSDVSKNGGTITFHATKDATEANPAINCTVNTTAQWDKQRGWAIKVTSVEGLDDGSQQSEPPAEQAPAQAEAAEETTQAPPSNSTPSGGGSGGGSSSSGPTPTMQLVCFTGELVEVPGTIQFLNSGQIILRCDAVIRVVLDGRIYITTAFELIPGESSYRNGEHRTIIGEISLNGSIPSAPLAINENWM